MDNLVPVLEAIGEVFIPTLPRDKSGKLTVELPAISVRKRKHTEDLEVCCWATTASGALSLAREVASTLEISGGYQRLDTIDLDQQQEAAGIIHVPLVFRSKERGAGS